MSGRIPPNRAGFAGYDCIGIPAISVSCVDCTFNNYLYIPVVLGTVTNSRTWKDYYPAATKLPKTWPHNCDLPYEGGFLEVEYPDVPPVSVRGIGFKPSWAGPTPTDPKTQYQHCYEFQWLYPGNLPPTSKGYAPGADRRWFYGWYDKNKTTFHVTDDSPSGEIKGPWTMSTADVDKDRYGPFPILGTITFSYCGECPEEKYQGPFELYLRRDNSCGSSFYNIEAYPGKVYAFDGSIINVPYRCIEASISTGSTYVYWEVDESKDPADWTLAESTSYPVKPDPTDTQYYLVLGEVIINPASKCWDHITEIKQLQYGDFVRGGGGGGGYSGPWKVTLQKDTTLTVEILDQAGQHNYADIGLESPAPYLLPADNSITVTASGWIYLTITFNRSSSKYELKLGFNTFTVPAQTTTTYYHRLAYVKVETVDEVPTVTSIFQYQHGGIYLTGRMW